MTVLALTDPPEGMSYFNAKRAERLKIQEQNSHLSLNRPYDQRGCEYCHEEEDQQEAGDKTKETQGLEEMANSAGVLKQQEEERRQQSKKRRAIKEAQQAGEGEDAEDGAGRKKEGIKGIGGDGSSSSEELSDSDSGSDFELDPEKGFDRRKYMRRLENPKDMRKVHVTVDVDRPWDLVYVGNDNFCEVTGLVPTEVLSQIPDYVATLQFSIQAIGVDFPTYEHSQLSDPIEVLTKPETNISGVNDGPVSPMGTPREEASKNKQKLLAAISASKSKSGIESYVLEGEGQGEYYM